MLGAKPKTRFISNKYTIETTITTFWINWLLLRNKRGILLGSQFYVLRIYI